MELYLLRSDYSVIMELSNYYLMHLELPWYRSVVTKKKKQPINLQRDLREK